MATLNAFGCRLGFVKTLLITSSSGWDHFVNSLFDWCVQLLVAGGHWLGMSYNEINIWIFCIIEPIAFVLMISLIIWQWARIRRLKRGLVQLR